MNLVEQIANGFTTPPLSAETLITNCGYGSHNWNNEQTKVAWTRVQHWIFAESARCDRFAKGRTKRLRFLSQQELETLTVSRLLAYRNKALSLESKPVELGPTDNRDLNDKKFVWFKQEPRWDELYERILSVLKAKQADCVSSWRDDRG